MRIVKADGKARVCISQSAVKEYGNAFIIVKGLKEIILLPVPKDLVKEMQALGRKAGVYKFSLEKLKKLIRDEALREAVQQ